MTRIAITAALVAAFIGAGTAGAQQQTGAHVGYVYPAGGRQGSTFEVVVGGQSLDGADGVIVSGTGVRARVVGYDKPLTRREINDLREKARELSKAGTDPAVRRELMSLRDKSAASLRRLANPVIAERLTVEVEVAADAEPGPRSLRVVTPWGATNPLVFCVGQLPEVREEDVRVDPATGAGPAIALPATVNGRIIPLVDEGRTPLRPGTEQVSGDVDRYRFHARRGQQVVVAVAARELMPYLADAVPGWFQATLSLFDANGRELAYDDDDRFSPDPVLRYQVPADGTYLIEVKDALYRGREDFVYRIAIGELPVLRSVFPLGGRAEGAITVEAEGWNLRTKTLTLQPDEGPGTYAIASHAGTLVSNSVPLAVDSLPEAFEREPNDSPKQAQRVRLPVIVNGRIVRPGDADVFRFDGRAGDEVVAEVLARRLGSPLDSVLELTDAAGRSLAYDDDHDDKGAGLITHQADSLLSVRLPADGAYFLRLADIQHKGSPEHAYRLRIGPPRLDFELRVAPSSINAAGNGTVPVSVHVLRKDGFSGEVALTLLGPRGFTLSGGLVPAGQEEARVTVTAPPPLPSREPVTLVIEGRAVIQGRTVVRRAVPADSMMQAFAYHHLVAADALRAFVSARGATRVASRLLGPMPVRIPAGGTASVRVALPPGYQSFENVELELRDPPEGITLGDTALDDVGAQILVRAGAKSLRGKRGNLIVAVSGERVPPAGAQQRPGARRRLPLGVLPAIPFEIVAPE